MSAAGKHYKHGTLDRDETLDLVGKAQGGCLASRNRLIEMNLRFIIQVIEKHSKWTYFLTREEVVHEGVFGLIKAIEKFELSKDISFHTYAWHWVRDAVARARMNQDSTVRLPVHRHGRGDSPMARDEEFEFEWLEDDVSTFHRRYLGLVDLDVVLGCLTDRERDIVERRYGIGDHDQETLEQVGDLHGVTSERIRQIQIEAEKKMREQHACES